MNKIIIYICLFFVSLGFVFIYFTPNKKTPDKTSRESFLVLWAAANNNDYIYNINKNYQLERCDFNTCQTIDSIVNPSSIDDLIIYEKNNILYINNNKIVKRNFIDKTEQVIFNFPKNHTLINSLTASGDYVAWVSFDGVYKYSNVLNTKDNLYKSTKIDFLSADEQVSILLDKNGQSDALILDVQNNVQESELWFTYYDADKKAKHSLVENGSPLFNVIKRDNNLFFYAYQKIYKINLDNGKKEEVYSWSGDYCYRSQLSNDAQWFVENVKNTKGSIDKYLLNFITGAKYLVEENVACGYYNSFWLDDKYYIEDRLDYYFFLDLENKKTKKWPWSNINRILVDIAINE